MSLNSLDDLIPITEAELQRDIEIQLAAMRARKETGRVPHNPYFAKELTKRLLRTGLLAFRKPVVWATTEDYPGGRRKEV